MLSYLKLWIRAVRPFAYPACIVPVFLGLAVAWVEGADFKHVLAILTLLGVMAAHTGGNLLSDYFDFKRGIDNDDKEGGSGVLVEGLLSPRAILIASFVAFAIAGIFAHFIVMQVGLKIVWMVLVGLIAGLFYSTPPFGFKYSALGELLVFIAFGVCITVGTYVVQTGHYSWVPVFYSIPSAFLVSAILHINNIRDVETDIDAGVTTLAGMVGPDRSRFIYAGFIIFAYVVLIFFAVTNRIVPGAAAAVVTLPMAMNLIMKAWQAPHVDGNAYHSMDEKTAQLSLAFGVTMILGIVLWMVFVGA